MDSANFPRHGEALQFEYRIEEGNAGAERGDDRIALDWRGAASRGRNTLLGWVSLGSTVSGSQTNVRSFYELGGFLNLSGLSPESLAGPHYGIARAIYMRNVGNGGEGVLNVPGYLGLALEVGNVWNERQDISFGSTRKDAAVFFGADTYIGPAYLAVGYDQKLHQTGLYLFLGKAF
jgi:NTE family protein